METLTKWNCVLIKKVGIRVSKSKYLNIPHPEK